MNKRSYFILFLTTLLFSPLSILAINPLPQPAADSFNFTNAINGIVGFIWPLFVGFAVLMFIVAGFTFLSANGEPGKIATAKKALLWGMIGVGVAALSSSIPFVVRQIVSG